MLLQIKNLSKHFSAHGIGRSKKSTQAAVDGVNLTINEGEIVGLIGESACGKTTTGRLILGLIPPTSGEILFNGRPIHEIKDYHKKVRMMFQNVSSALNPRMTVKQILSEAVKAQTGLRGNHLRKYVKDLAKKVHLTSNNMDNVLEDYPPKLSGGQRRRVGIARTLIGHPKLIIADEPVADLDVSTGAQILNLMKELQEEEENKVAYLLISHNLNVVRYMSTQIAVMYLGRIVEIGTKDQISSNPIHPYTQELLEAAELLITQDSIDNIEVIYDKNIRGCKYHPRCRISRSPDQCEKCINEPPPLVSKTKDGHKTACHWAWKSRKPENEEDATRNTQHEIR